MDDKGLCIGNILSGTLESFFYILLKILKILESLEQIKVVSEHVV